MENDIPREETPSDWSHIGYYFIAISVIGTVIVLYILS